MVQEQLSILDGVVPHSTWIIRLPKIIRTQAGSLPMQTQGLGCSTQGSSQLMVSQTKD